MRVITKEQVSALGLTLADVVTGLRKSFHAARAGEISWRPKSTINQPDGTFFIGALACWPGENIGLFHSIMGTSSAHVGPGEPHYTTLQVLSDYQTARPIAAIDGAFTSTILPAGVTALAAERMSHRNASVATFVGAGVQARVNLDALLSVRDLKTIKILGRGRQSTQLFADYAASHGLKVEITDSPEIAVQDSHIIVSSVPSSPDLVPFLDPKWVSPGAFVSAVDVGRSWKSGFEIFEQRVTDDRIQAAIQHREGRMNYGGKFDYEIADLIDGGHELGDKTDRSVVIHPGNVVGVLGITIAIWKRLCET